jgi:hypothetical protein
MFRNLLVLSFIVAVFAPFFTHAQNESLTLSVTPTLFNMTANPGQEWVSTVKVINSNPYELSVYADVVNFEAQGESGKGKFIPVFDGETTNQALAEWVTLERKEVVIAPEQTIEIPFRIRVPEDAAPGGHFGAILIGTKSLDTGSGQTVVETSQIVTSLVFLRVTGDIVEDGAIREFRSTKYLSERPKMDFELRFQNNGNVHILPQGDIRIFNMWGEERGVIPVNKQTLFGYVLPGDIRKYTFSWSGEWSIADIGRYTAVATLAYGEDGRQFADSETVFWILPWKIAAVVIMTIIAFVMLVTWAIKLYIRKMLMLAGVTPEMQSARANHSHRKMRNISVVAPIEEGILDLRESFAAGESWNERLDNIVKFLAKYKIFFFVSIAVLLFCSAVIWYVNSASVSERQYEVVIDGLDKNVTISSEQLQYETLKENESNTIVQEGIKDYPPIKIVNQSGVPGLAAGLRVRLESMGYPIAELTNELDKNEKNTVIVYAPEYDMQALELSGDIFGALTSAYAPASGTETPIVIYVGEDLENAVQ